MSTTRGDIPDSKDDGQVRWLFIKRAVETSQRAQEQHSWVTVRKNQVNQKEESAMALLFRRIYNA
jgi:hypothetical protein